MTVFHGHIHQEHHPATSPNAAQSLIFPLPVAGSVPKRAALPWDPDQPYKGIGFRSVEADVKDAYYKIMELPVPKG